MLHRAASNAYSWWWASHIRTKQSKWLDQSLQGQLFLIFILFFDKNEINFPIPDRVDLNMHHVLKAKMA